LGCSGADHVTSTNDELIDCTAGLATDAGAAFPVTTPHTTHQSNQIKFILLKTHHI